VLPRTNRASNAYLGNFTTQRDICPCSQRVQFEGVLEVRSDCGEEATAAVQSIGRVKTTYPDFFLHIVKRVHIRSVQRNLETDRLVHIVRHYEAVVEQQVRICLHPVRYEHLLASFVCLVGEELDCSSGVIDSV